MTLTQFQGCRLHSSRVVADGLAVFQVRAGVLSTTGASTNYVCDISFPTPEEAPASFFVLQGTAGLTMLND